jgi:hypothetical protein
MKTVKTNSFAFRQTPESRFSFFDGTWEELENLVQENLPLAEKQKDGVYKVPVPPDRFYSGAIEVKPGMKLHSTFESRREDEDPYISTCAEGQKAKAVEVGIILYTHDALAQDGDATTDADFEIVSVNASAIEGGEPLTPVAMMRNYFNLPGGTKQDYTADEFANSILFWSKHCMVREKATKRTRFQIFKEAMGLLWKVVIGD